MPDQNNNLVPGDPGYVPPTTGLINTPPVVPPPPAPGTTATATTPTAIGYNAQGFAVTDDQTVAGQIKKITGGGSPLMQQAETKARQVMNQRGLINSSLAVQAGQEAVLNTALPIATADAATYERAATNTGNAINAERNFTAGATNTASNVGAQLQTSTAVANADSVTRQVLTATQLAADLTKTQLTNANQLAIASLDAGTKTTLATLDAQNRQLLQTNANASSMYQQTVTNIANISINANLDATAKANAIASQLNLLNEGLKTTAKVASTQQTAVASLNLDQFFANAGGLTGTTPTTPTPPADPNVPVNSGYSASVPAGFILNSQGDYINTATGQVYNITFKNTTPPGFTQKNGDDYSNPATGQTYNIRNSTIT